MEIRNKRLMNDEFENERKKVLGMWPTGKEINFDEAIEFHKGMPEKKNCAKKYADAKKKGVVLTRTDSGVPLVEEQIDYLRYLQNEGRSDLLGTIIDSYSRVLQFKKAEEGIIESSRTGKWMLNGYPIVNHGRVKTRKVIVAVDQPVQIRGPIADSRLIVETGLAAGYTAVTCTPMMSFSQYSSNIPLSTILRNYQYVYRLMGRYEEKGVPIVGEMSAGAQVITPNSLTHALMIIEAVIAAEQGVKHISPVIHGQGNLVQDVAACIGLREICHEYLNRFGYSDVELSVVFTTWSGKFPADTAEAFAVICLSVIPPLLGGAQVAHVKTISEAHTIPRKEDNAASLRANKKVIEMLRGQRFELESKGVEEEIKTQKLETEVILDRVIDLGEGDVAVGAIKAFELGVLDQVFPTNRHVAGKVLGIRDSEGAVRYFDHGNLPFNNEILEFHREKIADREKLQGKKVDYNSMIDDIFSISKGSLVTRFNT